MAQDPLPILKKDIFPLQVVFLPTYPWIWVDPWFMTLKAERYLMTMKQPKNYKGIIEVIGSIHIQIRFKLLKVFRGIPYQKARFYNHGLKWPFRVIYPLN